MYLIKIFKKTKKAWDYVETTCLVHVTRFIPKHKIVVCPEFGISLATTQLSTWTSTVNHIFSYLVRVFACVEGQPMRQHSFKKGCLK